MWEQWVNWKCWFSKIKIHNIVSKFNSPCLIIYVIETLKCFIYIITKYIKGEDLFYLIIKSVIHNLLTYHQQSLHVDIDPLERLNCLLIWCSTQAVKFTHYSKAPSIWGRTDCYFAAELSLLFYGVKVPRLSIDETNMMRHNHKAQVPFSPNTLKLSHSTVAGRKNTTSICIDI